MASGGAAERAARSGRPASEPGGIRAMAGQRANQGAERQGLDRQHAIRGPSVGSAAGPLRSGSMPWTPSRVAAARGCRAHRMRITRAARLSFGAPCQNGSPTRAAQRSAASQRHNGRRARAPQRPAAVILPSSRRDSGGARGVCVRIPCTRIDGGKVQRQQGGALVVELILTRPLRA